MQQAVDSFRIVPQEISPASEPESGPEHEAISDEAINNARSIISEALDAYRRQSSGMMTPIDPLTVTRVLRTAVEHTGHLPLTLRVTGNPLAGLPEQEAADSVEFMRRDILARGHRMHLLRCQGAALDRSARRWTGELMADGARVRLLASDLPTVITLGPELGVLRTAHSQGRPETLLVRGTEVVGILRRIQLALWEQAVEFTCAHSAQIAPLVLDSAQSQVLHKLCAGMKDETAARQMNVSVRTYRRHVASILKSLDVSSRFEAGLKVAELGLVSGSRSGRPYGVA